MKKQYLWALIQVYYYALLWGKEGGLEYKINKWHKNLEKANLEVTWEVVIKIGWEMK
jgi:hypothetical protein